MSLNRRDFIKISITGSVAIGASSYIVFAKKKQENSLIRPPYAIGQKDFLEKCPNGCNNECSFSCPYSAINISYKTKSSYIDTSKNPCYMCDDIPCVKSCPTGALNIALDTNKNIGIAKIDLSSCLSSFDILCSQCVKSCDIQNAISLQTIGNISTPTINYDLCTGCGLCEYNCPISAIKILPT